VLRCRRVVGVVVADLDLSGGKKKKTLSEAMVRSRIIFPLPSSYALAMWP
jgi:hypothetical protein